MKTLSPFSTLMNLALLSSCALLTAGLLNAADKTVKPQAAEELPSRMVSLVLLLSEPRAQNVASVAKSASKAWSREVPESAVTTMDSTFVVKSSAGRFAISSTDKPYFTESDKLADELKDSAVAGAIRKHRAWLAVDWMEKDDKADLRVVYQQLGKAIAEMVNVDTLAIYSPDTDQFHINDATLLTHLKSEDPLAALTDVDLPNSSLTGKNTISIEEDDVGLVAARAEARKNWPEFLQAFKARGKDKDLYFSVKGPIVEGENSEYLWLRVIDIDDKLVHGVLDNDPVALKTAKHGSDIHIPVADVDDWLYSTGPGKDDVKGGYTLRRFDELADASPKN